MYLPLNNDQAFEVMEALIDRKEFLQEEVKQTVEIDKKSDYGNLSYLKQRIDIMERLIDQLSEHLS